MVLNKYYSLLISLIFGSIMLSCSSAGDVTDTNSIQPVTPGDVFFNCNPNNFEFSWEEGLEQIIELDCPASIRQIVIDTKENDIREVYQDVMLPFKSGLLNIDQIDDLHYKFFVPALSSRILYSVTLLADEREKGVCSLDFSSKEPQNE